MTKEQQNAMLLQELGLFSKQNILQDDGLMGGRQQKGNGNISIADQSLFMMDLNNTQANIITP